MDPVSALGLAASIIAVIQLTKSVLKNVGPSALNKRELNRLLSLASGFKSAYESLAYRLEFSEEDDSRAALIQSLEQPAKECKLVLECIQERLENTNFIRQYIVGSHFDKKFKRCIERLKDEKELFELVMEADQHAMLRGIKKFSQKTEEIISLVQSSAEKTGILLENLAELAREHHEETRDHFDKTESTLGEINATILAQEISEEERRREENKKAIIRWLSNTDPSSNHCAAKDKHEKTTGNWFIKGDTYKSWLTKSGSFLWLHGIPGCGKSVLCSTIIDETNIYCSINPRQDFGLAYYYFSFTDTEKQKPPNFLRSIMAQLLSKSAQIPEAVQKLYDSYSNNEPPLEDLKLALKSVIQAFRQSFLLVDALDECPLGSGVRERLCELLVDMSNWTIPGLHMLATSRKETDIETALSQIESLVVMPIQTDEVDADIRLYVKSQIANEDKLSRWAEKDEGIETTLVTKSDGMFRWVFCQIEALKKCRSRNEVLRSLKTLPRTLEETYQRILEGINEEDQARAASALRWLIFSKEPLLVEELAEASIINPENDTLLDINDRFENSRDILQVLSSLVTTYSRPRSSSEESKLYHTHQTVIGFVSIAHFSVQEYLISTRMLPSLTQVFRTEESYSQQIIAKSCLRYIEYYSAEPAGKPTADNLNTYPILDYSGRYWPHHVRACENSKYTATDMVCQLLSSESWLRTWLQINGLYVITDTLIYFTEIDPLGWAIFLNLVDVSRTLIISAADSNVQRGNYNNAIREACYWGRKDIVRLCLEEADIKVQGREYDIPLQLVCHSGRKDIVRLFLEKGVDVNAQGGKYGTALQAACRKGRNGIVRLLLEKGAYINAQGGKYNNALQAACVGGYNDTVRLLLDNVADVNAQGGADGTALQAACIRGYDDIVELLLDEGADINVQGGIYGNALQAACAAGDRRIVRLLLKGGADIHAQGCGYGTALQAACVGGSNYIVRLLLNEGADINAQGGIYGNALQAACIAGNRRIVGLLLKEGADIHAQGCGYGTALQAACVGGSKYIVRLLLNEGADINAQEDGWGTALQAACYGGHVSTVRLLLEKGADVNAPGGVYNIALMAILLGPVKRWPCGRETVLSTLSILLENGAKFDVEGDENMMKAAVLNDYKLLAELLWTRYNA